MSTIPDYFIEPIPTTGISPLPYITTSYISTCCHRCACEARKLEVKAMEALIEVVRAKKNNGADVQRALDLLDGIKSLGGKP